jgi:crotonobetainyl-CoA:carnitine CoA-transferase CaiB-like acyl-CoA transferase
MTGALAGMRVLDLSILLAAPQVSAILADLGADVVKVEPPAGDPLAQLGAQRDGRSTAYALANRGKRRVVLDPADPADLARIQELTASADVVVTNQPMKLLERWGCTPEAIAARNPAAVVVSVTCYGRTGPLGDQPGNGSLAEAFAGLTHLTGEADGPPMLPGVALGDTLVAVAGALGALAACWSRDAGRGGTAGAGQHVDVSMYEPIVTLLGPAVAGWAPGDEPPARHGSRVEGGVPRNVYRAGDGGFLVLSGTTDAQVARVLEVIGRTDDEAQARYARSADRLAHADELDALVASWIAEHPRAHVLAAFEAVRVPVAPVHDLAQLAQHPQVQARGSLATAGEPGAQVTLPGPLAHLSATPSSPGTAPETATDVADVLDSWSTR